MQGVGLGESLVPFTLILRFQVFCLKLPDIYIKAGLAVLTTGAAARRQGCVYATLSMLVVDDLAGIAVASDERLQEILTARPG